MEETIVVFNICAAELFGCAACSFGDSCLDVPGEATHSLTDGDWSLVEGGRVD